MKVKVNWKELGKQLWAAMKPVLLAAIGGGYRERCGGVFVARSDEQDADALGCRNRHTSDCGRE